MDSSDDHIAENSYLESALCFDFWFCPVKQVSESLRSIPLVLVRLFAAGDPTGEFFGEPMPLLHILFTSTLDKWPSKNLLFFIISTDPTFTTSSEYSTYIND